MKIRDTDNRLRGLTVIELLVIFTVVAILAAIILPVYGGSRPVSRTTTCLSNLKQIALGMIMYDNDWERTPAANRWMDQTLAYTKNEKIYHCPLFAADSKSGYGYAIRTKLGSFNLDKLKNPSEEPMVFDTELEGPNVHTNSVSIPPFTRHLYQNVGYADGHARVLHPVGD